MLKGGNFIFYKNEKERSFIFNKIKKRRNKKATLIAENLIYIIITLLFVATLLTFIYVTSNPASLYQEKDAKHLALMFDLAKPGMVIKVNMLKSLEVAAKEFDLELDDIESIANELVIIEDNVVTVKLMEEAGFSYSFFNKVEVDRVYDSGLNGYVFTIKEAA